MKQLAPFRVVLLPVILLLVLGGEDEVVMSQQEVPDFNITRAKPNYKDFAFQVGFEQWKLMHDQFQIYNIVIAVKHEERKHIHPEGYVEVWGDKTFIYSCSVPQTTEDSLGLRLKKTIETENAMLFFFRLNPRYIDESWFGYPVLRDDGSSEMNCVIRLKDFVGIMPAENRTPTTRSPDEP